MVIYVGKILITIIQLGNDVYEIKKYYNEIRNEKIKTRIGIIKAF